MGAAVAAAVLSAALPVGLVAVPETGSASALACRASATPLRPMQYSDVRVEIRTATAAAVTTIAHYKTTDTRHRAVANGQGVARTVYYISGATVGYKVVVEVVVRKGTRVGRCATYFIPRQR